MRDPKRIDRIINKLREFWYYYPDMRFWQIINYMLSDFRPTTKIGRDPFFWEEHTWEEILDAAIARARENYGEVTCATYETFAEDQKAEDKK